MPHRYLPHTADIRVVIEAGSYHALLADGVAVMRELLAGTSAVQATEERPLSVIGSDRPETFHAFLREVLFLHASEEFLPAAFAPDAVSATAVRGRLRGERADPARHLPQPEVKAVTRHGFTVRKTGRRWRAEVVFDV
jgi:SHS2 domain-containing protein